MLKYSPHKHCQACSLAASKCHVADTVSAGLSIDTGHWVLLQEADIVIIMDPSGQPRMLGEGGFGQV